MKPIFISYSSKHRDLTRELAGVIEEQYGAGSVWWDHELESRTSYSKQIKAALEEARVVVVVWTAGAMISDYAYAEAVGAQAQGKLVNVRPADMRFSDIPEPFNIYHIDEAEDHARVLATIAKVMTGVPIPTRVPLHEIYFRQHGHRLIDAKQRRLARDPREIAPTELLQAKFEVVGYLDATGIRAQLIDWCSDERPTSGRLIHGPGGLGKTRLMIEVAAKLRRQAWMTGFLDPPHEQFDATLKQRWQALDQLISHGGDRGLLIVLDYAEGRQDEVKRITERLSTRPENETRPVRLVLLARSAGEWWTTLHDDTPELQRVFRGTAGAANVAALPDLSTGQQRLDLFDASRAVFAPLLGAQGYVLPSGKFPQERRSRIESGAGYARPLAIQMEALLWLASATPPEAGATGVDELLRRVLGLERTHWKKLLGALDEERTRDMARGVAQVTAVQGVAVRRSIEDLLMADDFYQGQRTARVAVDPVVRKLCRVYGQPDGGVGPLEPDLIGEHHVATAGDPELIDGCLRWIAAEPTENQAKRRRSLLTVLQRATQPEHGTKANDRAVMLLDHLVGRHAKALAADLVAVMMDTQGALAERVDRQVDALDDESLGAIDTELPIQSLSLMDLSLHVAVRRNWLARERLAKVDALEDAAADQRETILSRLAASANTLGIRLSKLGRREEALAASREAVDLYRRLAQDRTDAFLPNLAASLNNLGRDLSALGRREEALAASQEAVDLYRRLAQDRPNAFLPSLAGSLNNIGAMLSALGRREEALAASQEGVDLTRRLAQDHPDVFLPDLARSLNNIGAMLSALGRREEALAASQEAVDLTRRLAQDRPDAFLPDLAMSLSNLGVRLSALGRGEEALVASQEAEVLNRRLAQARPDAFLPDLARSLNNIGAMLFNLGRREAALAASQEAVDIRRRLAQDRPDAFLPNLAMSLGVTSHVLTALDRQAEAAQAAHKALEILAPFVELYPETFGNLARAIGADLLRYSAAAQQAPDRALLERVTRTFDGGETARRGLGDRGARAVIVAILEEAKATGVLDEAALAELPESLVDGLRAAWSERSGEDQ
ncbi:MAG: putative O-linked N-acetylglucosamine transferase, SPINDLY family [Candidatus Accumulibacter regalis]|uniref:O-linked N-acetylglucosamine transferase, SPINDLY family n=1 Tax=Accumulibacter regalis TaxID=522306 RepID=A0A011RH48_ACCRE|nr:MAG: putative O-linked N-acetylglucosamine transferase, SPINDLY family [Candidatus Accumulibacter regalis]